MNTELIKEEKYVGPTIKGLKAGNVVEIELSDGKFEAVIKVMRESLMVVTLLKPMTSSNAHSYHWEAGNLKSVLFSRILKLSKITYDDSGNKMAA